MLTLLRRIGCDPWCDPPKDLRSVCERKTRPRSSRENTISIPGYSPQDGFDVSQIKSASDLIVKALPKGSSKIDYGKGRPDPFRSTGLASSQRLAGLRTCKSLAPCVSSSLILLSREEAFQYIGFNLERVNNGQGEPALRPPALDNDRLEGLTNRGKLLRAWIEISAWFADFTKRYSLFLHLPQHELRSFK